MSDLNDKLHKIDKTAITLKMTTRLSPESNLSENNISAVKKSALIMKWCVENWTAVFVELLSTCFVIFFGCMSCIPIVGFDINPAMYAPLTFGLAVLFNIQAFGHISGAHMNPAVTVASVIWGNTSIPLAVLYVIMQCLGAILGYGMLVSLSPVDLSPDSVCVTSPRVGLTAVQALGIEVVLTAALVFVCCGVWDPINQDNRDSTPLRFGLTVAGISMAGGPLTGASINPARSLGPAVWTGSWSSHWVYWIGPFVGGILAVLLYKYLLLTEPKPESLEEQQPLNVN